MQRKHKMQNKMQNKEAKSSAPAKGSNASKLAYDFASQNKEDSMAQLDCNVKSCCHNEDNCCCFSSIEVNGSNACNCEDTCCGSYFEDKSGEKNSAQTPHVPLSIARQATNCMYNDDKVCRADHVDISGIRATAAHETVCATFQEK